MSSDFNSQNEDQNNNHDHNDDHHDHGRFNMSILGNPNNLPTITEGDYTLSPFFTGPLTITNLSGGVFTVYGDYQDINFVLTGNTYSTSGTFNDLINNVSIHLGGNTITLGGGVNTIYGTIRDLNMTDTGGTALGLGTTGVTVNTLIENTNIDLTGGHYDSINNVEVVGPGNTITAGNGVNTVYGDMRDLTLTAGGATGISDPTFATSPNTTAITQIQDSSFTFGNNHITLGNGVNTVYGDMRNLSFLATPSTAIGFNVFVASGAGDAATTELIREALEGDPFDPALPANPPHFNTFTFNSNTILVGNGVNVIYGHLQTLNASVLAGGLAISPGEFFNFPGSGYDSSTTYPGYAAAGYDIVAGAWQDAEAMPSAIFLMGGNIITAGVGNNTIYGDFQNFVATGKGGLAIGNPTGVPLNSVNIDYPIQSNLPSLNDTLTLEGNTIKVGLNGSGINTVYGNMQDWMFTGGPEHNIAATSAGGFATGAFSTFNVGGNKILTGNGSNTVFGTMRDINCIMDAGLMDGANQLAVNQAFIDAGGMTRATVNMLDSSGNGNTISVGNGVNLVYGDMRDISFTDIAATGINLLPLSTQDGLSRTESDRFTMGHNTISTGFGTNIIYGDFHDLHASALGGTNSSTTLLGNIGGGVFIAGDRYSMGHNTISAGMTGVSNNTIYGDVHDVLLSVIGGNASAGECAFNQLFSNRYTMGSNNITTGNGSSTIYGDAQLLSWSVQGGNANGPGSYAEGQVFSERAVLGGNIIHVLGGGSDTLYGDAQTISLSVHGGTVTNGGTFVFVIPPSITGLPDPFTVDNLTDASAHMINTTITLQGNSIYGGSGGDIIYSSLQNLNFSAVDGKVLSGVGGNVSASFSGDLNFTDGGLFGNVPDTGSTIIFGNDIVVGGSGNDTIIGSDALNLSGLDVFLAAGAHNAVTWMNNVDGSVTNNLAPGSLNTITFGDNMLTGGGGNDQFVFTLLNGGTIGTTNYVANQGTDTITDFDAGGAKDKLVIHTSLIGQHTAAALDTVSHFNTVGNVTTITFNGAGSIVLNDSAEHFASFVDMANHGHLIVM